MARLTLWPAPFICLCLAVVGMAAHSSDKIKRSVAASGAAAAASFTETEDGQLSVVTRHGAPFKHHAHGRHESKEEKETERLDSEVWEKIHKEQLEAEKQILREGDPEETMLRRRRSLSRNKRFMSYKRWFVWPKGIVPYDFNFNKATEYHRREAIAAMTRWHKYTCIRFVPWVLGQTKEEYGLTEESHVTFTRGSGCAAHQGNIHSKTGQFNSCCRRSTCTHELGHTLGLFHEHQSPWRDQLIKVDPNGVPAGMQWTYAQRAEFESEVYQYDLTNAMHYGGKAFRIMYEDLKPLIRFYNQFYMYKDVSLFHSCKELHCASFTRQCHNDGFVTLVDNQCSCLCPPGLDPSTDCATTVKQVSTSSKWPAGSFALFSSIAGCPANEFQTGSWQHRGKGNNRKSDQLHLAGSFDANVFRYNFCVKEGDSASSASAPEWETGQYCVLSANGQCPQGFGPGFIQFDDHVNSTGQAEGRLPDGHFEDNKDTRLQFCCRDDGFASTPLINLPSKEPLVLFVGNGTQHCQEVAGMRWTKEFLWFDSYPENAEMNGSHPFVSKNTQFRVWFCHYVPVDYNCGGEITLTRENRHAVIKSPNFPSPYGTNMECTWVIKAGEEGGQVLLNFDVMQMTSKGDDCLDSVELRYVLPGQPGIRFCGDGLTRTIRSLHGIALLTLRSDGDMVTEDIGFNLTASLYWPEEDSCYEPSTKGRLYRGQKNYTRGMKACLPWTQATKCLYHAFQPRDYGSGLEENYCRNPDDTVMPWCYTDENCNRDYCDVCNVEKIYDRSSLCPSEVCQKSQEEIVKLGCAGTCGLQPPSTPDRGATCGEPDVPADAQCVDAAAGCSGSSSSGSAVGARVSLQCSTGSEYLNITCLSDGQWSPAGYVCGACADGWAFFNGSCYKHFNQRVSFADARKVCADYDSQISSMKNTEEMVFVSSLRHHMLEMWIGATDMEVEGQFRWEDGSLVHWFNWHPARSEKNAGSKDCLAAAPEFNNITWNDFKCIWRRTFACKYGLSERTHCADRHRKCESLLLTSPGLCTQHPDLADQMCPYSCGLCLTDSTPQCTIPAIDDASVVSPQGQPSVTRGSVVQYACRDKFVLTQGQLSLACGKDGQFIGTLPVCTDQDTVIQDSNDVELIQRPETTTGKHSYTSLGPNLGIKRKGVIKQWKFFSPHKGFTVFQVWRPNPAGGNLSFTLVGQNQVETKGQGAEMYHVQEADWITVQPGDSIGLFETGDYRGRVPYTYCKQDASPGDYGVIFTKDGRSYGDFSTFLPSQFASKINCRTFSFKAVIHPVSSVPAEPDVPTNQVSILSRYHVGNAKTVYIGNSTNFYIPADGYVKEWQFFAKHAGSGAFQVWRRREDKGVQKFQLIGQNEVKVTSSEPSFHTLKVPEGERIAVQAGDIIGFLYGKDRLGLPYSFCSPETYPESYRSFWFTPVTPDTTFIDDIYRFRYNSGRYFCRTFSFRAIVEQSSTTPKPNEDEVRTSEYALVSRTYVPRKLNVFVGESNMFYIPADGYVKEWQFFSKHAGTGAFQVWRRLTDKEGRQFELIGQNPINLTSNEARPYRFPVPEGERIAAQAGDVIGFLYGEKPLGIPFVYCQDKDNPDSTNISSYGPLTPATAVVGDIYPFRFTGGKYMCRIFSFRAVVEKAALPAEPASSDVRTSYTALQSRYHVGSPKSAYLGDSNNYHIPADGHVKEWLFFSKYAGTGAFQVWRRRDDMGERKFELIGQNTVNLTSNEARVYRLPVPAGERIAVKAGDIIGVLYGENRLGVPFSYCSDVNDPDNKNTAWYTPITPESAVIGQVYSFSTRSGTYSCRIFSFKAVVDQA